MPTTIDTAINWIPAEFGGRRTLPAIGLRSLIRFQRKIRESLTIASDVQLMSLEVDPTTWRGTATLEFFDDDTPTLKNAKEGELFELLEAYNVIAVGKILAVAKQLP